MIYYLLCKMLVCSKKYILLISFVSLCTGQNENKTDNKTAVERVIQKMIDLTSHYIKNENSSERDKIMKTIENKLIKSSKPLGSKAGKYIKIIMQGLKILANNVSQKNNKNVKSNLSSTRIGNNINIERTIKDKTIKKYKDLEKHGMEIMMNKTTGNINKRRMNEKFVRENTQKIQNEKENVEDETNNNMLYKRQIDNFNIIKDDHTEAERKVLQHKEGLTTAFSCDEIFHQTCSDIGSLNVFVCKDNRVTMSYNKICNGVADCPDGSDEKDCISKAKELLQKAISIVSRIDIYLMRNCFLSESKALLLKQNSMLNYVLQKQLNVTSELSDEFSFKRALNEVVVVINSVSIALENSVCLQFPNKEKIGQYARKPNPFVIDNLEELTESSYSTVSLKSCTCNGSFCANLTCTEACKRVCWHKNNLNKWICEAADEGTSVSLDLVCDGKLDCHDKTDEIGCNSGSSNAKFEANELFDNVIRLITAKIALKEYSEVKNELTSVSKTILDLQKAVIDTKIDEAFIKMTRDIIFTSLQLIYEKTLDKTSSIGELEDIHLFLLNVNERIMSALKRTHTGNKRVISGNGCYCRRGECALIKCSSNCSRACAMGPKLTKYWCKDTVHNNTSVTVDEICNGQFNCPHHDDELQCSMDVCRKHHLILLHHSIRDVGDKQKGTLLGEALLSWKTKAMSIIKAAEGNYTLTAISLRDIVAELLHDLVMVYASLEDNKRSKHNKHVFKVFYKISQALMKSLKFCAN